MFLLFASPRKDYAAGGWHDYRGSFPTLEEASSAGAVLCVREGWMYDDDYADAKVVEWWHVVDFSTGKIVAGTWYQPHGAPCLELGVKT